MKEKRACILLIILAILFTTSLILAKDDAAAIDKAYSCLKAQLKDNCGGTQNTEQAGFNLLAMAHDSKVQGDCKSLIKNRKKTNCWGETESSSCSIKATAISTLALENIGENTEDSINWLLEKTDIKTGLIWFLEIDANNLTECEVNGRKITINENKKISGQDPAGLVKSYNNYWFEIKDINKNYTISCKRDFITTLLYKKPGSNTIYVSSDTHFAPASDSTEEKVNAYCFTTSSQCDYEGSLWAAIALAKDGKDVSPYIPYLSAFYNEAINKKYLPSAFLYMLTSSEDYYIELASQQEQSKYWEPSNRRLYDTSIAMLALQKSSSQELINAKDYLLSIQEKSGEKEGCWNDNTALILYSGWPKEPSAATSSTPTTPHCEDFGHYCLSSTQCKLEDHLENFYCTGLSEVCCKTQIQQEICSDKNGIICRTDEECTKPVIKASDSDYCCLGSCEKPAEKVNECTDALYSCKDSCSANEAEKIELSDSCNFGQKCCAAKPVQKSNRLLIILLVVLIILVVLAILFRNQLKIWVFRAKTGFGYGKSPRPITRPPISPLPFRPSPYRPIPGRIYPRTPQRRPEGRLQKDKDFDETMKKLRDMSK